jgi:carboxylesterase
LYELFPLRRIRVSQPVISYADACARVAQIWHQEAQPDGPCGALDERCRTLLLTHGASTEHVLLLIHGFTNSPYQFQQLAPLLHQQGHSVLAMRLPRHGCADRLTTALAGLRAAEVIDAMIVAVDIAHGLGKKVTVLGFSLGGVVAAWLAQNRRDLHHVVLVSPAIGIQALPPHRHRLVAHLLALLPNFFQWWNPTLKAERVEPHHAYPRFASRALAVLLRLGLMVRDQAAKSPPGTRQLTLITNPSDPVISHQMVARLMETWMAHGATVTHHAFPAEWDLLHDLIDPLQPAQQVDRVYPLLVQWIEQSLATPVAVTNGSVRTEG